MQSDLSCSSGGDFDGVYALVRSVAWKSRRPQKSCKPVTRAEKTETKQKQNRK